MLLHYLKEISVISFCRKSSLFDIIKSEFIYFLNNILYNVFKTLSVYTEYLKENSKMKPAG